MAREQRRLRTLLAATLLLVAISARGEVAAVNSPDGQPLSVHIANYAISARLDTVHKTLDATEILEYRNSSSQPLSTFPFHLYLNAFRPQSSFSQEAHRDGTRGGSGAFDSYPAAKTGGIQITDISAEGYGDLRPTLRFTAPDDGNLDDHTVAEVTLPQPLAPGNAVRFHITFHDNFPLSVARNGYKRDFFMGAQWFPKVGVFWHGAWNCHQYHADSEFFSDFGVYQVDLTLPRRYVVGASGIETAETLNADGSKTLSFRGEDIHDFAWAASPRFVIADDTFRNSLGTVRLHALVLESHAGQARRYLSALKGAMQKFDEWYGPYPYTQITLIDPEPDSEMGGMEYPTLITGETSWWEPSWDYSALEVTTVHEFGHQYWYGMVATNEFEQAWLDEGINSYSETKVMAALFGRGTSYLNARTFHASDSEVLRDAYIAMPDYDSDARKAWEFVDSLSYASITYGKTATVLTTLESLVGEDVLRQSLHIYFLRYRFTHPDDGDFLRTVIEVSGRPDLEAYFNQAIYGTQVLDYSVDSLTSARRNWWENTDSGPYRTNVVVRRRGSFLFPVTLEVRFADGSRQRAHWDGADRWRRFSWDSPSQAVSAQIDPDHIIPLDVDLFNNSYTAEAHRTARYKLTNYWVAAQQLLAQWVSFLV
jgi:hypothetical protein